MALSTPTITAFERSPDRGRGLARDMRVRRAQGSGLLEAHPNLCAYVTRAEERPAYRRAFADQLAVFNRNAGARGRA